ncbi:MAG: hypothetical protein KDA44_23465, partial [Planctomycetales bacterium]|nr:hypothetical protein [Planctomycetales bacterium]
MQHSALRSGISLLEVLVSMFVLLFGLLGVASMFPVGNFYAASGEKYDRTASAAPAAFAELKARGYLRPENWVYAPPPNYAVAEMGSYNAGNEFYPVMNPQSGARYELFNAPFAGPADFHPGHAFVIDPMGVAEVVAPNAADQNAHFFPYARFDGSSAVDGQANTINPWGPGVLAGEQWPVRRVTLAQLNGTAYRPMTRGVAELAFSLRDDLADTLPEERDRPGEVLWKVDDNGTPEDISDDTPLARNYDGTFTWLATVVPTSTEGLALMQPGHPNYGSEFYDVSVAIFSRRDTVPSVESERAIAA